LIIPIALPGIVNIDIFTLCIFFKLSAAFTFAQIFPAALTNILTVILIPFTIIVFPSTTGRALSKATTTVAFKIPVFNMLITRLTAH
jgi:hypothetical protein